MELDGFSLVSSFCRPKGRHGGSAVFAKISLATHCSTRHDLERFSVLNLLECSAVEYRIARHPPPVICSVYRPPGSGVGDFLDAFERLPLGAACDRKTMLIGGDFNIDLRGETRDRDFFVALLRSFSLSIGTTEVTRPASSTCLDNIFTDGAVDGCLVEHGHVSDHAGVYLRLKDVLPIKSGPTFTFQRIFSTHNLDEFRCSLECAL